MHCRQNIDFSFRGHYAACVANMDHPVQPPPNQPNKQQLTLASLNASAFYWKNSFIHHTSTSTSTCCTLSCSDLPTHTSQSPGADWAISCCLGKSAAKYTARCRLIINWETHCTCAPCQFLIVNLNSRRVIGQAVEWAKGWEHFAARTFQTGRNTKDCTTCFQPDPFKQRLWFYCEESG